VAARPVVRNRSAGDIQRQRALDYRTLLVAEIVRPEYASGQLLEKLTMQWASYIAFLASFCYAGIIWLNHRAVFARVRYCDHSLHLANLFLLLTSALIPFPTAILSAAIQSGNEFDARVAVTLYAGMPVQCAWRPKLAMLIFLALPVFYGISSEGLTETRLRLQFGRAQRRAVAKSGHEEVHAE
jgi:uncharacterized membrane protein